MNKRLKTTLIATLTLVALLAGSFLIYVSIYYRPDETALAVLDNNKLTVLENDFVLLDSSLHGSGHDDDMAIVFYPGAKVDHIAYLPLLEKISIECDVTCILVKMPFNMAIFDSNAADEVIDQFPDIRKWYLAGHSMGGAMASNYGSNNQDRIDGLILLGAYIYGDYPAEKTLTIYGSLNTSVEEKIDYTENIVVIEGGNHAQFGNYGKQKGDQEATISSQEQQDITVQAIKSFLARQGD